MAHVTYIMCEVYQGFLQSWPSCVTFHDNYVHCKAVIQSLCISLQDEFNAMKLKYVKILR
jgi:hypothetical protein